MKEGLTVLFCQETSLDEVPTEEELTVWARAAYLSTASAQVSIKIVDRDESQALNLQYRNKNNATNVLSFPLNVLMDEKTILLGDLAICAPVVRDEAEQQEKSLITHWAHMVIHGMLHLQGYDHQQEDQAFNMENIEQELMAKLGYPDPYTSN